VVAKSVALKAIVTENLLGIIFIVVRTAPPANDEVWKMSVFYRIKTTPMLGLLGQSADIALSRAARSWPVYHGR
jgi:hypothetical protein